MPPKNKPLTKSELAAYESKRDLAAELLQSVREMKAGQLHGVSSPGCARQPVFRSLDSCPWSCGRRAVGGISLQFIPAYSRKELFMKVTDLMTEAASLPVEERARLVDSLLQTLNPPDEANTPAWLAVARRRLDDLDTGRVKAIPGEEVLERVRRRLGK